MPIRSVTGSRAARIARIALWTTACLAASAAYDFRSYFTQKSTLMDAEKVKAPTLTALGDLTWQKYGFRIISFKKTMVVDNKLIGGIEFLVDTTRIKRVGPYSLALITIPIGNREGEKGADGATSTIKITFDCDKVAFGFCSGNFLLDVHHVDGSTRVVSASIGNN